VVADSHGIFAWGWNSVGSGFGEHAEAAAIRRASKKRLKGATIYIASKRNRNGKYVTSMPCYECNERLSAAGIELVYFITPEGKWLAYVT
jgi:deoxycytidylate deaminase